MRVIVTGAAGGIGTAIAEPLARVPDTQLLIVDRNPARGESSATRLGKMGGRVVAAAGDLADSAVPAAIVAHAVDLFGGLDAIVSAAGVLGAGGPVAGIGVDAFDAAFAVNARPTLLLGQAAYPHLCRSRGAIVAISSTGARHPVPGHGAYSASKAALTMLVRQMALEWGPDGIRVNAIAPGPTVTPMAPSYADPVIRAQRVATIPLRRLSEAGDIAAATLFLLGPGGIGITGVELDIDGGIGLTTMQLSGSALGRQ
jgi:NAD(P)-dependent dehydrogenase (short-subunit alcohol dehydrogenase family)